MLIDNFRKRYAGKLPVALIELLIGNVVVGNYNIKTAITIADSIAKAIEGVPVTLEA